MNVLVKTKNGIVNGTTSTDYDNKLFYCFYGIPYAKQPIGKLRFKAPEELENWPGIKDCTKVKDGCISRHALTLKFTGSEDCLFLNIYTKELPGTEKQSLKPVLVWVHGGGFMTGSGNPDMCGPEFLITQDIVIVTITYRLGALGIGFLCLEDESLLIPGNAGVKDVLMALKWINENIENFNGDSQNVTLAGQSSGGGIVHCLMLCSLARELFHKAIIQTGSIVHEFSIAKRDTVKELAFSLGCKTNNEQQLLKFLQSVPAIDIVKGAEKIRDIRKDVHINSIKPFGLAIEKPHPGAILTERPLLTLLKRHYHKMPVLMGYTDQEGLYSLFIIKRRKIIIDNFEDMVPYSLKLERGSELSKLVSKKIQDFYFQNEIATAENKFKYIKMMGDVLLKYPTYRASKRFVKDSNHPVYFYQFSIDANLNLYKKAKKSNFPGASHTDDICYLFKTMWTPEIKPGSIEDLSIRRMTNLWGNFIKTGNPNPSNQDSLIQVDWKPLTPDVRHYVDIRNDGLVASQNLDRDEMAFWDEIYKLDSAYLTYKL